MADLKFLDALASTFESLPGVGKKTARRYAYHVIEKMTDEDVEVFAKTLIETKNKVKHCPICGMLSTQEPCEICSSKLRDRSKIMVVKDTKDVLAIENMGEYLGLYHCLNGLISPMDGIGPDDLTINLLEKRLSEAEKMGFKTAVVPKQALKKITLPKNIKVVGISVLNEAIDILRKDKA